MHSNLPFILLWVDQSMSFRTYQPHDVAQLVRPHSTNVPPIKTNAHIRNYKMSASGTVLIYYTF